MPALDADPNRIATTSSKIIEGTLGKQFGFKGVVVTDALEMRGLITLYPNDPSPTARAAVDAIKAGADIVTLPTDLNGAYRAILKAVQTGEISESRIDESVRRVLALKAAVGLDRSRFVDMDKVDEVFSRKQDFEFAQHVADEAGTLVRNAGNSLPLATQSLDKPEKHCYCEPVFRRKDSLDCCSHPRPGQRPSESRWLALLHR